LGETLNAHYEDGSRVYCEQVSHHPPVSYLLYYGPKKAYKVYGPILYSAHAGLNSLTVTVIHYILILGHSQRMEKDYFQ